jgi:uncharacterized RDD family membrane protein YckC
MTCGYCGSRRYSGESRCRTCGCRTDDALAGEFSEPYTQGALATQPRHDVQRSNVPPRGNVQPIVARRGATAAAPAPVPRQGPLFADDQQSRKVVPIAPNHQRPPRQPAAPRVRRPPAEQTQGNLNLNFVPQPPARKTLGTTVEARIYCEYPVATASHRAIAGLVDWTLVLAGYGLFLLVFHQMGGTFAVRNGYNIGMFAGMLALIGLAYGLLWTVVGCRETPGTRCAQLRITTFDGDRPNSRQRLLRLAGSCVSMCTIVGLLWSLADEESLTWQDHMSDTFPTPVPLHPGGRR